MNMEAERGDASTSQRTPKMPPTPRSLERPRQILPRSLRRNSPPQLVPDFQQTLCFSSNPPVLGSFVTTALVNECGC